MGYKSQGIEVPLWIKPYLDIGGNPVLDKDNKPIFMKCKAGDPLGQKAKYPDGKIIYERIIE